VGRTSDAGDAASFPSLGPDNRCSPSPPERRILIVAEALGYGGTESHLVTVLPRLAEAGLDISVFCLSERGPRATELEQSGVHVFAASRVASRSQKRLLYPLQIGRE